MEWILGFCHEILNYDKSISEKQKHSKCKISKVWKESSFEIKFGFENTSDRSVEQCLRSESIEIDPLPISQWSLSNLANNDGQDSVQNQDSTSLSIRKTKDSPLPVISFVTVSIPLRKAPMSSSSPLLGLIRIRISDF